MAARLDHMAANALMLHKVWERIPGITRVQLPRANVDAAMHWLDAPEAAGSYLYAGESILFLTDPDTAFEVKMRFG